MIKIMRKVKTVIPYLLFLMLIVIAFRGFLFTSGIIGHTWDWGMPHFSEQYWDKLKNNLFVWDDSVSLGKYCFYRFELMFWIILYPFSFLGAQLALKIILITLLFISGISMYNLSKYYKINSFWSVISGILYMFSPVVYSRLVAGHLSLIMGYSVLPILIIYYKKIIDCLEEKNINKSMYSYTFIFTLLLLAQVMHTFMLIVSFFILIIFFVWDLIFNKNKIRLLMAAIFISTLFILFNSYWLFPSISDYISTKSVGGQAAGLSMSIGGKVAEEKEMPLRKEYIKSTQQPLYDGIRLYSKMGLATEYVWPIPNNMKMIWHFGSSAYSILFFVILLRSKKKIRSLFPFVITAVIGIAFVSGYSTIWGKFLLEILYKFVPIVYMDISHITRMLVMLCFSYPLVVGYVLYDIEGDIRRKWILRVAGISLLLILTMPFLNGNIIKPLNENTTQPLSIKINEVNPEDELVYKYFKSCNDDFRISYLPPIMMSWPGDTDLCYEWNVMGSSPKPEFLGWPDMSFLSHDIVQSLYSLNPSSYLGKLFGLANVKYIVYPHYDFFISFKDFIQEYHPEISVEGFKDYKAIVDEGIKRQEGLVKLQNDFKTVTIYENKNYLPHIYASTNESIIFSNNNGFVPLSYTDCFENKPVNIFVKNEQELNRLKDEISYLPYKVFVALSAGMHDMNNFQNYYAPATDDYVLRLKMKPNIIWNENDVESSSYTLPVSLQEEICKWSIMPNMVIYAYTLDNELGMVLTCTFDGGAKEDEYVRMYRSDLSIDLTNNPVMEVEYKVQDRKIQVIELIAKIDFDKDGVADECLNMGYTYPAYETFQKYIFNIYDVAKERFPYKKHYNLVGIELYPHKYWRTNCSDPIYKGEYAFWIKGIKFVKYSKKKCIKEMDVYQDETQSDPEQEKQKWRICKKELNAKIDVLGKGVAFKEDSEKIQFLKEVDIDLLRFQYIKLSYVGKSLNIKNAILLIDIGTKENVYLTNLIVNDEMCDLDINIYDFIQKNVPQVENFNLKSIKVWCEVQKEKGKDEKYGEKDDKKVKLEKDVMFYIDKVTFYSLNKRNSIVMNEPIISIDNEKFIYEYRYSIDDENNEAYVQYVMRLNQGWHSLLWLLHPDEYLKLVWAILSNTNNDINYTTNINTEYIKVNPTRYVVDIKNADKPFWLVFSENYHEGWRAYLYKKKNNNMKSKMYLADLWQTFRYRTERFVIKEHFNVNGYANGWWVNPEIIKGKNTKGEQPKDLQILIEFRPQRYYEIGLAVAGLVLLIGIIVVLIGAFKKQR